MRFNTPFSTCRTLSSAAVTVAALGMPQGNLPPTATAALRAFMAGAQTVGKASFTALGAR